MHLDTVAQRAEELAGTVGPVETLLAVARLEDALRELEGALDGVGEDPRNGDVVIDLREVRSVLAEVEPTVERADSRISDLRAALEGR